MNDSLRLRQLSKMIKLVGNSEDIEYEKKTVRSTDHR